VVTGHTGSYGSPYDLLLAKFDGSGNHLWTRTLGGPDEDIGRSVVEVSDGGIIVTARTRSYDGSDYDLLLAKFDGSGNHLWTKTLGGSDYNDYEYSLAEVSDGGLVVTGETYSYGTTSGDVFLTKFDGSGNHLWTKTVGGTGRERGRFVLQVSDGGLVVVGWTDSYGAGEKDVLLAKFDGSGNTCMGESVTPTVQSISPTITTPSPTVTTPSLTITSPSPTITSPTPTTTVVCEPLIVFVDIKPQSCPNPLNIKGGYSKGNPQSHHEDIRRPKSVLPVAILGMEYFDVATVDFSTVLLEGVAPIRSAIEDVSTPFDGELCGCTTEGADGFDDLTLKFYRHQIVAALGDVQDGDEVVLTLTGALSDGTPIEGADCVLIISSKGDATVKPIAFVPSSYGLSQNYPNPFNPQTAIRYALAKDAQVTLVVYNIAGQKIKTLLNEEQQAGYHECVWDGKDVASGIYFYRLQAGDFVQTRKMVLLK